MHTIHLHRASFIAPPLLGANDASIMKLLSYSNTYDSWKVR
jgi:hypothetical protein